MYVSVIIIHPGRFVHNVYLKNSCHVSYTHLASPMLKNAVPIKAAKLFFLFIVCLSFPVSSLFRLFYD